MYKYYNANALNKFENDCVIRSISVATDKTWDYVYEHLSDIAQCEGTMMDDKRFVIRYLDKRYERLYDLPKTVGEVSAKYPNDIILITMNGHITCSKFGVVIDSFDCRDRVAEFAWVIS